MSAEPSHKRSAARGLLRFGKRVAVMLLLVMLVVRVTGAAESLAYWPSRAEFLTPFGDEDVWITTADGVRLHGWLMRAQGVAPGEQAPAVLHVHGNAGNISSHESFSRFLTEHGMHVLVFDYRCYGRSDEQGRLNRTALVTDTNAALSFLLAHPEVDGERVGVLGVSLGGAFALRVAADEPRARAVATLSAFSSWAGVANDAAPVLGWLLMPGGVDPADSAAELGDRPFLVMHGERDPVVRVRHAEVLGSSARDAGVPVEVWTHAEGDHNAMVQTIPAARDRLVSFFVEHLASTP